MISERDSTDVDEAVAREGGTATPTVDGSARWRMALVLGAAGFALQGQYLLTNVKAMVNDGLLLYGIASAAFIRLAWRSGEAAEPDQNAPATQRWSLLRLVETSPTRVALVALALGFIYATMRLLQGKTGNASYWDALAFWLLAAVGFTMAFLPLRRPRLRDWWARYRSEFLTVAALTLGAGILRFALLGDLPDVVVGDEGRIGALGLSTARGEINNLFATVFGHSTLYLLFIGIPEIVLGPTPFAMRLMSALPGTLTVPLVYLLGRRLFGCRVAMVSAVLLAVSHFHLHFSRVVVTGGIVDALFATLAVYFLYRGIDRGKPLDFVLCGLTVALHLYFYMGARLIALVIPAYLVCLLVVDRRRVAANGQNLLLLLGSFLIVGAPMVLWVQSHPEEFMARTNQVGVIQSGWLAQESLRTGRGELLLLWDQFVKAMLAFVHYPALAFYDSTVPMFDFLTSMPLVLGLAYSVARTFDRRFLLLNVWFLMAVGFGRVAVVSPEQGAYRILIVMPAAAIMAAVALSKLVERGTEGFEKKRLAANLLLALFLTAVAAYNVNYYFREWASAGTYADTSTRLASIMGKYLGTLDRDYKGYLFGAPVILYGIHPSVDFLSGRLPMQNVNEPLRAEPAFVDRNRSAVFLFIPQREPELSLVQRYFPGGTRRELYDQGRKLVMIVYEVPKAAR
ncbi:MAG: glycosyltransferase family 39 protein [Chloroflexota bacterium]